MADDLVQESGPLVISGLSATSLEQYFHHMGVGRAQIITLTEPTPNVYTLVWEPSAMQRGLERARRQNIESSKPPKIRIPAARPIVRG